MKCVGPTLARDEIAAVREIWIAATAARAGSLVLTYDSRFRHITRVGSVILD